ncbi:TadE-like protein [Maioricimonas rarisocia]|uniref:TadE-like protein n=1 Tax=Maioricimonas rarisocia TaxID=2528026 RepID=A0A517Z851_9PLAN|nr:TadE family protein [Maioricimonas rarisocia]QDU38670.1 TadE-like protein [Maioricimonas rarisocia]
MSRQPHRSTVRGVGQLVVDVALLLPVFVILTCGLVEFSRAVAVHQAMQETVNDASATDDLRVSDVDLERSVRASAADTLGVETDQVNIDSDGSVVTVALQAETISEGPVSFLAGTSISARTASGQ